MSPQYRHTFYYYPIPPTPKPILKRTQSLPTAMPSATGPRTSSPKGVSFTPIPATYSRLPHDDELYVMKAFARHCSHCPQCARPYEVHRRGGTLCSKGHARALDVAQYVFSRGSQAFSVVDLDGNRRVQMEIPADCSAVRELLKAMERGLRLRRDQESKLCYFKDCERAQEGNGFSRSFNLFNHMKRVHHYIRTESSHRGYFPLPADAVAGPSPISPPSQPFNLPSSSQSTDKSPRDYMPDSYSVPHAMTHS